MKPSTRKKIVQTVSRRLEEVLGDALPATLRLAERQAHAEAIKEKPDLNRMSEAGMVIGLWHAATHDLKKRPEPTPQELKKFLADLESLDLNSVMRTTFKSVLRKLPPFPPGKKPSLTRDQQKQALAEVHRLTSTSRINRKAAYAEVAKGYDVHWRTIQNLCVKDRKRGPRGDIA